MPGGNRDRIIRCADTRFSLHHFGSPKPRSRRAPPDPLDPAITGLARAIALLMHLSAQQHHGSRDGGAGEERIGLSL